MTTKTKTALANVVNRLAELERPLLAIANAHREKGLAYDVDAPGLAAKMMTIRGDLAAEAGIPEADLLRLAIEELRRQGTPKDDLLALGRREVRDLVEASVAPPGRS